MKLAISALTVGYLFHFGESSSELSPAAQPIFEQT